MEFLKSAAYITVIASKTINVTNKHGVKAVKNFIKSLK